ncbi:hypothetical protein [Telluria aromaticivorans]|uniref:Uncharacterized protein n=1 Tax=Telluria aromaticivorans TaxID=2725995 RepID=A0A7Y2JUW7_9BURK|nr:hypothetical protein [Telluria aromaticivorans]NNG21437.1 hypothetical protein [Telluria aromaticivorans]
MKQSATIAPPPCASGQLLEQLARLVQGFVDVGRVDGAEDEELRRSVDRR